MDADKSDYRQTYWPRCPDTFSHPDWLTVNRFKKAKFAHHVITQWDAELIEWCTEQFGEQAIGGTGRQGRRYWTRGVWTYLINKDEHEITLMFIERGLATAARLRWG